MMVVLDLLEMIIAVAIIPISKRTPAIEPKMMAFLMNFDIFSSTFASGSDLAFGSGFSGLVGVAV